MVNCRRLVQPCRPQQIQLSIPWSDPPLKHHSTGARHGKQVAIPGGIGRIGGQGAVGAMVVDEVFEVVEEGSRD
jgi:hypothetical protein